MKNFLNNELVIIQAFTKHIDDKFRHLKYGIQKCKKDCCEDLREIRYDLLKYQQNLDPYNFIVSLSVGVDKFISLPATSITVTGVYLNPVAIASIVWQQLTGPGAIITSPGNLITDITGLQQGTYSFGLTVTDKNGSVSTDSLMITVQASTEVTNNIYWGFTTSDPYSSISSALPFSFQFNQVVYTNTNIFTDLNFTSQANETYLVLKEPVAQPVKISWFNTSFNFGTIPDQVFRAPFIVGVHRYYVSRIPVSLGTLTTKITFQ